MKKTVRQALLHPRCWAALLLLPWLGGCELLGENEQEAVFTTGIYVANQGNFGDGNGSVTVYDPADDEVTTLVHGIGSIIQSIHLRGDALYVLANSGDRVYRYDLNRLEQPPDVIEGVLSPRYMAFVDDAKAYITSLYEAPDRYSGGKVNVIDLASLEVVEEIPVGDNPEGIAVVGDRAYVANSGFGAGNTLTVIDTRTDEVVDTIDVECDGPRTLAVDAQEEVFVFCTGRSVYDEQGESDGAVRVLNGATGEIVRRIELDGHLAAAFGQDAFYVPEEEEIYAVQDGQIILRFDTAANTLDRTLGPFEGDAIGAVAYDPAGRLLYLGRVDPDFTESGRVTMHARDGSQVGSFTAGVAPTYIVIRRAEG